MYDKKTPNYDICSTDKKGYQQNCSNYMLSFIWANVHLIYDISQKIKKPGSSGNVILKWQDENQDMLYMRVVKTTFFISMPNELSLPLQLQPKSCRKTKKCFIVFLFL